MRRALPFLLLSSLLLGCGDGEAEESLVGEYQLDRVAMVTALEEQVGLTREAAEVQARDTRLELTCDENGKFVLRQQIPGGKPLMLYGVWTLAGERFRLEANWRDGQALEPPEAAEGEFVAGALHLRPFDSAEGTYALVLRRR